MPALSAYKMYGRKNINGLFLQCKMKKVSAKQTICFFLLKESEGRWKDSKKCSEPVCLSLLGHERDESLRQHSSYTSKKQDEETIALEETMNEYWHHGR